MKLTKYNRRGGYAPRGGRKKVYAGVEQKDETTKSTAKFNARWLRGTGGKTSPPWGSALSSTAKKEIRWVAKKGRNRSTAPARSKKKGTSKKALKKRSRKSRGGGTASGER